MKTAFKILCTITLLGWGTLTWDNPQPNNPPKQIHITVPRDLGLDSLNAKLILLRDNTYKVIIKPQ